MLISEISGRVLAYPIPHTGFSFLWGFIFYFMVFVCLFFLYWWRFFVIVLFVVFRDFYLFVCFCLFFICLCSFGSPGD